MDQRVWKADLGNGFYRNPILYADYSDPDVIRVGADYFMIASSFCNVPAIPLLHSRDLVNWKVVNYVLDRLPFSDYEVPAHGRGVWAPAIRYHEGKFWVCFPMPDEGIFFSTAKDPFGKWSEPFPVWLGKGRIDPCPFWDDDGKAYLVTAYAKSRCGIKSILRLAEMKPDGTGLMDDGHDIYDGHHTQPTIEGPKLYKKDGFYYILAPAGGVKYGWQTALRSKNIWGPYEEKIVMFQGGSPINGPHQGGLVDTPSGETWFLHFQDVGTCGRIVHLQPAAWKDGWPVIGTDPGEEGCGQPVLEYRKPDTGAESKPYCPDAGDEFDGSALGMQWQWNANYKSQWYSLRDSRLCLYAQPHSGKLCDTPHLLLQKFPTPNFFADVRLNTQDLTENVSGGLLVLGGQYGALRFRREKGSLLLEKIFGEERGDSEQVESCGRLAVDGAFFLRLTVRGDDCTFSYSVDGERFWDVFSFTTSAGIWVGAKLGLFCTGERGTLFADWIRIFPLDSEIG